MVGHGGHRRLRRPDRHARRRPPPAALRRRTRAAASASRAGSASRRAHDMFVDGAAGRPRRGSRTLLETLEVGSLCAHGGGMPAPIRSLLDALPRRAGARMIRVAIDGVEVEVAGRHDRPRRGAGRGALSPDALLRRAPGPVRRLPGLPGRRRGRRPGPVASACTTPVRRRHGHRLQDSRARRIAANVVELVLSELPWVPAEHTELAARGTPLRARQAALDRRPCTPVRHDAATPTSRSTTSRASPAGAACGPATRSRGRSP